MCPIIADGLQIVLSLVVLIAIAGAVAAVPLGGGSGHDAGSGNQDSGNGDSGISSAELEDLQTVANQFGISLQEATDRYAWNDNFALAVAQIREAFPEAFAGAEIVDGNRAWVAFAGQTPEAARAMIDTFGSTQSGISVEARADVGFTEVELQRAIKAAHFAVLEATHVLDASTLFDYATGKITTNVVLDNTASDSVLDGLKDIATNNLTNATRADIVNSITASVVRSAHPVLGGNDSSSEHLGGEVIGGCTSGFVVETPLAVRGISTAGHCGDDLTDDGASLTFEEEHQGTHGDFQWHSGSQDLPNEFYAGSESSTETNKREVNSKSYPTVGQTLCLNGATTHKDCQEVRKLNVCNGDRCDLVQMGARHAAGGDSGGPVYWENTAYGLHQGYVSDPFWPFTRDVFSRTDRIFSALDVSVAIN